MKRRGGHQSVGNGLPSLNEVIPSQPIFSRGRPRVLRRPTVVLVARQTRAPGRSVVLLGGYVKHPDKIALIGQACPARAVLTACRGATPPDVLGPGPETEFQLLLSEL